MSKKTIGVLERLRLHLEKGSDDLEEAKQWTLRAEVVALSILSAVLENRWSLLAECSHPLGGVFTLPHLYYMVSL